MVILSKECDYAHEADDDARDKSRDRMEEGSEIGTQTVDKSGRLLRETLPQGSRTVALDELDIVLE